ncbi:MAG: EAL domain-containing protein [Polyangiaceae bacterium]|nr:EAL domain-containing protein [Polyangiaceae bacterium]
MASDAVAQGAAPSLEGLRVLLVDDEEPVRRAFARRLTGGGAKVIAVDSVARAVEALTASEFDVVLADLTLPGEHGLNVVRAVREKHLDVACVIVTGRPDVDSAVEALRLGVFDYLEKAEAADSIRQVVARAGAMTRLGRLKREAQAAFGRPSEEPGDLIGLDLALTRTLERLWMAYQPIVRRDGSLYGYEALMRSGETALPHPGAILSAAERLGRLPDVGRRTRSLIAESLPELPGGLSCFVNLHPSDLGDPALLSKDSLLDVYGARVVLEVTERETLDRLPDPRRLIAQLRERECRVAVDDLGAGYAGLTTFAQIEPDIVKIDMSLVRGVDQDRRKAQILDGIVKLCHELDVTVVAEGVETTGERDNLLDLGCDLFQGYLIARPAAGFGAAAWPSRAAPVGGGR